MKHTIAFILLLFFAVIVFSNVSYANSEKKKASLKKKVYEYEVHGKIGIGEKPWTKRQKVPGIIVDIDEIEKLNESHPGALCDLSIEILEPDMFKVIVGFCGGAGHTATGKIRVTVYYKKNKSES